MLVDVMLNLLFILFRFQNFEQYIVQLIMFNQIKHYLINICYQVECLFLINVNYEHKLTKLYLKILLKEIKLVMLI